MDEGAATGFPPAELERNGREKEPGRHGELFERARGGDAGAWQELIALFTPLVENLARRVCRSRADVDDVAQEVWLLLLRNADKIRSPECLPGWLQRVTRNTALRQLGSQRAEPLAELPEEYLIGHDDTGRHLDVHACRKGVQHALRRLQETDQRLLAMLMAEERPDYAKISRQLDRPIGSIGPTRQRLLKRLSHDPAIVRLGAH